MTLLELRTQIDLILASEPHRGELPVAAEVQRSGIRGKLPSRFRYAEKLIGGSVVVADRKLGLVIALGTEDL